MTALSECWYSDHFKDQLKHLNLSSGIVQIYSFILYLFCYTKQEDQVCAWATCAYSQKVKVQPLYSDSHVGDYMIVSVSCSDYIIRLRKLAVLNIGSLDRDGGMYKIGQI